DVSHILVGLFHELYTKEVMSKETVKNLTLSSDGSTKFHKKCMTELHQAHLDHKKKLEEYNTVEREIMQARARAVSADERAINISSLSYPITIVKMFAVPSHFRWCLEESALKKHKLLVPSELFLNQRQLGDGPRSKFSLSVFQGTTSCSNCFYTRDILLEEDEEKSMMTLSSDSAELTSIPPQHRIRSEKKKSRKDKWRENMKHEARIEDRSLLARLEERHNFLKNPRFLPLDGGSGGKLLTKMTAKQAVLKAGREVTKEIVQVFASNPEVVEFREWIVGRVYEVSIGLRNVSTVSRQLRVLPPKSAHFSLGLGKFPGKQGIVAPGMCAQYSVRFMPDALADVHDELEVLSQSEQPLVVKIKAQRTPPVLIVPEAINCGFCLVGGVKVVDLPLKNVGGNGRFCIMKRTSWPAANFKTVVNPSCLDLGLFQIRPSVFEVLAGQVATLEILFSPHEDTSFKEELVIVCDNCQVKYVTIEGRGETAAVELVSVSNSEDEDIVLGEMADITADHLVRFPPLNPHSYFMKQIIVHNST
uniref:Deleted in lung and esophageal cancer protein 1 Ig-like domain-containing protein n=1 Tax=Ciona savignyi TaxID=51511 RepID=H2ZNY1_CIOSA